MATVEMDDIVKPFSLKFAISNIVGAVDAADRKPNFITFKPPRLSTSPPDFLEPQYFTTAQDKPIALQGILCSIEPSKDKSLKRDVDMLKDRTQTCSINLDDQIHRFIELGPKLGLSFNSTSNTFSNKFDVKHCISTFVDLVPKRILTILKIESRIS